jgi:N-hydroxyarylamine O-acetyltransferase
MAASLNLDAYFERIGFRGMPRPDLPTLQELHRLHPQAIPFDGLSPFLGEPVRLDIDSLQEKLVSGKRGGYCYEQNILFWQVLRTIGFRVKAIAGRVRLHWPPDVITPRSHMVLLVPLPEGLYVVDVGFGKLTLTAPVRLEIGLEQSTPHEIVRITETGPGLYAIQASLASEWKTLLIFDTQEVFPADYEMFNWYYSTHPKSPFVTGIMMGRPEEGRRHGLLNTRYSVQDTYGNAEVRHLTTAAEFREVLVKGFGVNVGLLEPHLDTKFDDLLALNQWSRGTSSFGVVQGL